MPRNVKINWKGKTYGTKKMAELGRRLSMGAHYLERSIKRSFPAGPAPSAPGGIPHVQKGGLLGSITTERSGQLQFKVGSRFAPGEKPSVGKHSYAWYLEFGTPKGKIKERPYLRAALRREKRELLRIVGRKSRTAVKK